ncbi:nuclear transport factor 2 family protein [Winogradskyella pulchriflava]|uniref:Nuclear transport factor 2 family protein n=1 Tax=Winogradskyella pulchriflava TaxID=1110688 RepID=A0ABV6QBN0_9FLAO
MTSGQIVKAFYDSDLANDPKVVSKFFHKECELHWTSSQGFILLKFNDINAFFKETRESYNNLRFEFTHFIEAGNFVTTRHTLFCNTIENPDHELVLAHFSAIWEVKDVKLYRCYEISHLADENNELSMKSYSK